MKGPVTVSVLAIWHWRLFGLDRGTRMLLSHVPAIRRWFEAPLRRARRARRGLADEFGLRPAAEVLSSLEYGEAPTPG